jgi:hypothetical protein
MSGKFVFACALVAALSFPVQRGLAQDTPPFHRAPWPIQNGFNHQPTQNDLRASHVQDVTPDEAREIDRLYDQLMSNSEKALSQPAASTLKENSGKHLVVTRPKQNSLARAASRTGPLGLQ